MVTAPVVREHAKRLLFQRKDVASAGILPIVIMTGRCNESTSLIDSDRPTKNIMVISIAGREFSVKFPITLSLSKEVRRTGIFTDTVF